LLESFQTGTGPPTENLWRIIATVFFTGQRIFLTNSVKAVNGIQRTDAKQQKLPSGLIISFSTNRHSRKEMADLYTGYPTTVPAKRTETVHTFAKAHLTNVTIWIRIQSVIRIATKI